MVFVLQAAQKEAERKKIEAGGIKSFQDTIGPGLTENYLRLTGIQATRELANSSNAKIVIFGSGQSGFSDGSEWTLVGDEDIDTTAVVTVGFKSHPDALGVDWRWERDINNNMNIRAWITVGPESDASGILVDTISIKGLTDISENMRTTPIEIEVLF